MTGEAEERFSVYIFFPDGSYNCELSGAGPQEAVEKARDFSRRPAATIGIIQRIIITDSGDLLVFEWLNEKQKDGSWVGRLSDETAAAAQAQKRGEGG